MSLMIKALCTIFVIGFAGMFVLKKPDGKPWVSSNDFLPNTQFISNQAMSLLNQTKSLTKKEEPSQNIAHNERIYRWKSADGYWQYSDQLPANQQAEAIQVSGNLNKDLSITYESPDKEITETSDANTGDNILPVPPSPSKISQLMDEVKKVKELMENRRGELDKAR